jgi:hypothetical protein
VVPKHRRAESAHSLASVGAPMRTVDIWPEAVGYGPVAAASRPMNGHPRFGPPGNDLAADEPAFEDEPWEEWQDWRDWGPPPALHPDHPSAPVPRIELSPNHPSGPWQSPGPRRAPDRPVASAPQVELSPDHPSGPWPTPGPRRASDLPQRRPGGAGPARTARSVPPRAPEIGDNARNRRLHAVPDDAPAMDRAATAPAPPASPGRQGRPPNGEPLRMAGQVLTLADGQAAQIARRAQIDAAAMVEAAERDAAAIREAAQRDATEMRARLDSMLSELGQMAAYLTESYAIPPMPATLAPLPAAKPDHPGRTAQPAAAPVLPDAEPGVPRRTSARPTPKLPSPGAGPGSRPEASTRPRTMPAGRSLTHGRQGKAMRAFVWATAGMLAFASIAATTEIAEHGFSFFTFREGGVGETPGSATDQQFEAHRVNERGNTLPVAHTTAAPTGKHRKTS